MSALAKVVALADSYRLYEVSGLLADLRHHLDPALWERVRRESQGMSPAQLDEVIELLEAHLEQVRSYTRTEGGKAERVRGYTKLSWPQAMLAASVVALVANQDLKHPEHVKTPQGAKWYDQPIGSVIYAKPHHHPLKESQKLVYVGAHAFSVPQDAPVYVASGTDLHDDAAVAAALKAVLVAPPGKPGKMVRLFDNGTLSEIGGGLLAPSEMEPNGWKLLPAGEQKVPISIKGKLIGWAPQDWKLYGGPGGAAVWAKGPGGEWHLFTPAGEGDLGKTPPGTSPDIWVAEGKLTPLGGPVTLAEGQHPPSPAAEPGWLSAKTDIGGVQVTAKEIDTAISTLNNTHSTAVKQPLAKAGHPLAAMDYHAVAKAELAAHPQLKVPPGTKSKHVGQVKVAVLHHLGAKLTELAAAEAAHKAAEEAKAKAQAQAEHAQAVAGGTVAIGGVQATKEQVQAAYVALEATKSTAIKQTLKAKGSPLAEADYWAVVHAYQKSHPEAKQAKAKPVFIAALKDAYLGVSGGQAPEVSPYAKQLHDLIENTKIPVKEWNLHMVAGFGDANGALAAALLQAHSDGKSHWVVKGPPDESKFHVYAAKPQGFYGWEVTPEHKLTAYAGTVASTISEPYTLLLFKKGLEQLQEPLPPKPAPPAPKFTEHEGWDALDKQVKAGHAPALSEAVNQGTQAVLGHLLKTTDGGTAKYIKVPSGSNFPDLPTPVQPQLGASGHPVGYTVYQVSPDHSVTSWDSLGEEHQWSWTEVKQLADKWLKPEPPEAMVTVAGKQVTQTQLKAAIAELEDSPSPMVLKTLQAAGNPLGTGTWGAFLKWQASDPGNVAKAKKPGFIAMLKEALGEPEAATPEPAKPEPAKPEPTAPTGAGSVAVHVAGKLIGYAPPGSTVYVTAGHVANAKTAPKMIKLPDGHWWSAGSAYFGVTWPANSEAAFNQEVASGKLVQVPAPSGPATPAAYVSADEVLALAYQVTSTTPDTVPGLLKVKLAKLMVMTAKHSTGTKYADQYPSGGGWWTTTSPKGGTYYGVSGGVKVTETKDGLLHDLTLAEVKTLLLEGGEPAPSAPAEEVKPEPVKPAEPAGDTIKVVADGKVVGEVPAGSKIYKASSSATLYVKKPDGKWVGASYGFLDTKTQAASAALDNKLAAGTLTEVPPPTAQDLADLAEVAKLRELVKDGAVDPAAKPGADEPGAWGYAVAQAVKNYLGYPAAYVAQTSQGWKYSYYSQAAAGGDYYEINPKTLTAEHHVPGETVPTPVTFSAVKDAITKWVTPNSVVVGPKLYKHGHYYKAKSKTHLEIKAGGSKYGNLWKYKESGQATYAWHDTKGGVTEKTPAFAAKYLAGEAEYHEVAKELPVAVTKKPVKYATGFQLKVYHLQTDEGLAEFGLSLDGSALVTSPSGLKNTWWGADEVASALAHGAVVDQYGNTVVKPGVLPEKYWLFGVSHSKGAVETLLGDFETGGTNIPMASLLGITGNEAAKENVKAFSGAHGAITGNQQRAAVAALLRELLEVPENKAASGPVAEPVYLKVLPPGIHGPKDIFTFDEQGQAKPVVWDWPGALKSFPPVAGQVFNPWSVGAAHKSAKIKEISQQFGEGKIVGTHPAALKSEEKAQWLAAFKAGDMVTVFTLDAKGGKVSPAHPGAPQNPATHQIIWAPWGAGEIPASKEVEGNWSDYAKVVLPKAEINNYLIKAGLQHAEYLSEAEKRSWVTWHRKHAQDQVDLLSKIAWDRWLAHDNALTEVPAWTDNVQPAKSYDAYLEDKTPAASWGGQALTDFVGEHKAELQPFVAQQSWYSGGKWANSSDLGIGPAPYSARKDVVQAYLDDLAAKELAEKLKPKYHTEPHPDGYERPGWSYVSDQHGWKGWWREGTPAFRDQARAVSSLTRLWGFKTPETRTAVLDGTEGIAVHIPAVAGTLLGADMGKLSQREVSDLAREHVFDWAVDNAWSHPGVLAKMPDGSVVGLDKSHAFDDFGAWDGLSLDGMNHYAEQAYSQLYQAVRNNGISHEVADQAYKDALMQATRMSRMSDARYREILEEAFKYRAAPPSIDEIVARKNELPDDFHALWGKLYATAGWTLPELPVERLRFGLHSGFSEPSFFDHVMAAKSYGATAFFAGTGLDDSSFLVWTELGGTSKNSPRLVRGESALRGAALAAATNWAAANETHGPVNIEPKPQGPTVKGMNAYYSTIIKAAKAVSRHAADQMWDGPVTKGELKQMNTDKVALAALLQLAEEAIGKGPDSQEFASLKETIGHPVLAQSMAKFYLAQISQIEDAKNKHSTFKPGDLPKWVPPKLPEEATAAAPPPKPKVKVTRTTAVRELGSLSDSDGELHLNGQTFSYPGDAWRITLPTGEVIEVQDKEKTSTKDSHTGRVRFKADAAQGSSSLERIRAQLQEMGVSMEEAEDHDMELFYWRHLAGVLADRMDRKDAQFQPVWNTLKDYFSSHQMEWNSHDECASIDTLINAGLSPETELALWRAAWAHLTSPAQVQEFTDKGGYLPHFKHWDIRRPEAPNGKPVWYRFDADPKFLATKRLSHELQTDEHAVQIASSGGLLSTEGRLRVLGKWITGTSSTTDMQEKGSSGVLYLRTNYGQTHGSVKVHPRTFAQTTTYGFDFDGWGDIHKRKTKSAFDLKKAASIPGGSSNETDIKDGASLLDDIELLEGGVERRNKIIQNLKSHGITQIRGLPVEQRVVSSISDAAYQLVAAQEKDTAASWFDHPADIWVPPVSGVVAHAAIETAAETAAQEPAKPGSLAPQVAGKAAVVAHHLASQGKDVSQMFYGQPSKPAVTDKLAGDAKATVSTRVAAEMHVLTADIEALLHDPSVNLTVLPGWGKNARERAVAGLVKVWATSNSSPIAVALQNEAHALFGLAKPMLGQLPGAYQFDNAAAQALQDKYGPVLREFLRSMWQLSQQDLEANNLDHILLYRIMKWDKVPGWAKGLKKGDVIEAPPQRPIASWGYIEGSAGVKGAGIFGKGAHHVLFKATFPRQLVLSYPKTGFGSFNEVEFTMLDAPGQWEVVDSSG